MHDWCGCAVLQSLININSSPSLSAPASLDHLPPPAPPGHALAAGWAPSAAFWPPSPSPRSTAGWAWSQPARRPFGCSWHACCAAWPRLWRRQRVHPLAAAPGCMPSSGAWCSHGLGYGATTWQLISSFRRVWTMAAWAPSAACRAACKACSKCWPTLPGCCSPPRSNFPCLWQAPAAWWVSPPFSSQHSHCGVHAAAGCRACSQSSCDDGTPASRTPSVRLCGAPPGCIVPLPRYVALDIHFHKILYSFWEAPSKRTSAGRMGWGLQPER